MINDGYWTPPPQKKGALKAQLVFNNGLLESAHNAFQGVVFTLRNNGHTVHYLFILPGSNSLK